MKTAISVPDGIFQAADTLAKKLKISRSELYTRAMVILLNSYRGREITSKLDDIYSAVSSDLDPILQQMQDISLTVPDEWS